MRRSLSCAAALAVALVFVAPAAHAQTLDEIIAKNIQAKGGVEKLKETTSVRMTGLATLQGMDVPITSSVKRPYYMNNVMEMQGQKMVQGFDGTTMWMSMAGMPAQEIPAGPQVDAMKQNSTFDPIFLDYKTKGHQVELVGKETDGDKAVHHLIVKTKEGLTFHYYLDSATGLETKFTTSVDAQGQKMQIETRLSDYRTVDGRTLPFKIAQIVNGTTAVNLKYDKIEFNVPMDDAMFKMPK